jgi:hypothetical protein
MASGIWAGRRWNFSVHDQTCPLDVAAKLVNARPAGPGGKTCKVLDHSIIITSFPFPLFLHQNMTGFNGSLFSASLSPVKIFAPKRPLSPN